LFPNEKAHCQYDSEQPYPFPTISVLFGNLRPWRLVESGVLHDLRYDRAKPLSPGIPEVFLHLAVEVHFQAEAPIARHAVLELPALLRWQRAVDVVFN
jgi:hypothetical protein